MIVEFEMRPLYYQCRHITTTFAHATHTLSRTRGLSTTAHTRNLQDNSKDRNEEVEYDGQLDQKLGDLRQRQKRTPWHREGIDTSPVQKMENAASMTKGIFELLPYITIALCMCDRFMESIQVNSVPDIP